jgi:periplasmic divalent cation tolerance protein
MISDYVMVFVTTKDKAQAETIAKTLLAERLIACANIVGPVESFFSWEGKVDCAEEFLMVMKTRQSLLDAVVVRVKGLHSYEVPEVLAVPIVGGLESYFGWMDGVLR